MSFHRFNNTFEILSTSSFDHGQYKIWIQAEIYNPNNQKIITNKDFYFNLIAKATQPIIPKFEIYGEDGEEASQFET